MRNYVVITVPQDLLAQVTGEILSFALDANHVEVVHESVGRVLHVHPEVADAWYQFRRKNNEAPERNAPAPEVTTPPVEESPKVLDSIKSAVTEPAPAPVPKPVPPKKAPSA